MSTIATVVYLPSCHRLASSPIDADRSTKIHNGVAPATSANDWVLTAMHSVQELRWVYTFVKVTSSFLEIVMATDVLPLLPHVNVAGQIVWDGDSIWGFRNPS